MSRTSDVPGDDDFSRLEERLMAQVVSDAAVRRRSLRLVAIASAGLLVVAGAGVVWAVTPTSPSTMAGPTAPSVEPSTTPPGAADEEPGSNNGISDVDGYSEQAIMSVFDTGKTFDYIGASTNQQLAQQSDLVISGEIVRVNEGPKWVFGVGDGQVFSTSMVLVVSNAHVASGALELNNDGFVYIVTPGTNDSVSDIRIAFPQGMKVVAYLASPLANEDDVEMQPVDPDAGRPAGQAVYMVGPQSLVMQYPGSSHVLWPILGEMRIGHIEDALPGGPLLGGDGNG